MDESKSAVLGVFSREVTCFNEDNALASAPTRDYMLSQTLFALLVVGLS